MARWSFCESGATAAEEAKGSHGSEEGGGWLWHGCGKVPSDGADVALLAGASGVSGGECELVVGIYSRDVKEIQFWLSVARGAAAQADGSAGAGAAHGLVQGDDFVGVSGPLGSREDICHEPVSQSPAPCHIPPSTG